ncbi:hypothetical protein HpCK81_13050 [Helicobacter pylori]
MPLAGAKLALAGRNSLKSLKKNPPGLTKVRASSRYQEVKEKVAASLSHFFHRFCDLTSSIFKKNGVKKDEINEK